MVTVKPNKEGTRTRRGITGCWTGERPDPIPQFQKLGPWEGSREQKMAYQARHAPCKVGAKLPSRSRKASRPYSRDLPAGPVHRISDSWQTEHVEEKSRYLTRLLRRAPLLIPGFRDSPGFRGRREIVTGSPPAAPPLIVKVAKLHRPWLSLCPFLLYHAHGLHLPPPGRLPPPSLPFPTASPRAPFPQSLRR